MWQPDNYQEQTSHHRLQRLKTKVKRLLRISAAAKTFTEVKDTRLLPNKQAVSSDNNRPLSKNNLPPRQEQYQIALKCAKNDQKVNLSHFDLRGVDLPKANLVEIELNEANLNDANLRKATLSKASLAGADLSEADLYKANLDQANLKEADLSWTDLSGASLVEANLNGANLKGANLFRVNLKGANLKGANLYDANLAWANLKEAQIDDSTQIDVKWQLVWQIVNQDKKGQVLYKANLRGANLRDTYLYGADLGGIDLAKADLRGANLSRANLSQANMKEANLDRADLGEANLRGADLYEASMNGTDLKGTKIDDNTRLNDEWQLVWQIVNQDKEAQNSSQTTLDEVTPQKKVKKWKVWPKTRQHKLEHSLSIPSDFPETIDELWEKAKIDTFPVDNWQSKTDVRIFLLVSIIMIIVGLGYTFWIRPAFQQSSATTMALAPNIPPSLPSTLTPTTTSTPTPQPTNIIPASLPAAGDASDTAAFIPPTPDDGTIMVTPAAGAVGWASSADGQTQFNDPNIHVGLLKGHIYHGAIQFDLSQIPPNALITSARLELTGLGDQNLNSGGLWHIRLLAPAINTIWPALTYEALHNAAVDINVLPALTSAGLKRGTVNVFPFGPEQLVVLQKHLANGVVSFRLDGPTSGSDNFFTWDSGYREEGKVETQPVLRIVAISREYVVVTSTPTPENAFTAVAMLDSSVENTAQTPTPLPPHWVTPIVVTPRPIPGNTATATYEAELAAAEAQVFGTATPTPLNVWTTTPTPTPTPPNYVVVTSTPTPENVVTAAARAAHATEVARTIGTYTPVPQSWITPIIVTPMPSPGNAATAEFQADVATAQAILSGQNAAIWTATPTPIFVSVEGVVATPWAAYTPTPTPPSIPQELVGKIAFLSNRSGGEEPLSEPLVYIIDPDGSNLAVLTDRTFYDLAIERDSYSADQRFRVFVKDTLRFDGAYIPALYFYDYLYNAEHQITHFGSGLAWDPVWSPTREQIVFVSNDTQDDEIWIVDRDGSNLLQLTESNEAFNAREIGKDTFVPEVNRHPSWSPDGSKIVFWSTRTGHGQIWIMDADGNNLYSLSTTIHDDWSPVWIKYTDPHRSPAPVLKPIQTESSPEFPQADNEELSPTVEPSG